MKFSQFSEYLEKLESIASRNEMTLVLSELLKSLDKNEIKSAMYLMQGRVVPRFINLEFNFAGKQMLKVLATVGKADAKKIKSLAEKTGDLGLVAEQVVDWKSKGSDINKVYDTLRELALASGKGSVEGKMKIISELLRGLDKLEAKFITRMVVGHLRLGLSDKTVLDALSWAVSGDKSNRDKIERAYSVRSDIGLIAEKVLTEGMNSLKDFNVEVGLPVASKLVEREKSIAELFERMGVHMVQAKYDGLRAQIHFSKKGFNEVSKKDDQGGMFESGEKQYVRIFSRNMESLTEMFPDVADAVSKLGIDSVVIDSEVIGYDETTENFFPFQETSTRRRKYGVAEKAAQIPIRVMAFDLLYLNGKDMTLEKLETRISKLEEILKKDKTGKLKFSDSPVVKSEKELEDTFDKYVEMGLEGIISKKLGTIYEPGTRNFDWIKLKFTVKSHVVDTIDTVVLGYYFGRGQRARFGLGALLLGIYNEKSGKFESVAKLGTGITDEQFPKIKSALQKIELKGVSKDVEVSKLLTPDVWVEPKIVVEVSADEITKSKNHLAARDEEGRGLSLRFPRMKVFGRDKGATETTSVKELERLYKIQKQ